jgi:phenylalanyl-tRNA synthetase alpha chain
LSNLTPQTIQKLYSEALKDADLVNSQDSLDEWRVKFLGRKGALSQLLSQMPELTVDEKKVIGTELNKTKQLLETKFEDLQFFVNDETDYSSGEVLDVTLPGIPIYPGKLHPTTQILRDICKIFTNMGFDVAEGPEVEWDLYNFEKLNIPKGHPARDMWNTLWIDNTDLDTDNTILLRTHTSPMQARLMEQKEPPVRVIVPGKCYRYEATDATHEWHFYQIEGLAVDKGINFSDLKGTLYEFARQMFGSDRKVRFRCDYFPFVEPGVDMSIDCFSCGGKTDTCRICRGSGWIEIMGAGMVHPKVLSGVGYDPEVYTGFAFGLGPERIAMLKYGIDDIRHFYSNNLKFLRQF